MNASVARSAPAAGSITWGTYRSPVDWSKYSSFSPENSACCFRSKSPRLAMPSSSDQPIGKRYSTSEVPEE